jgi:hypothetical protein
MVLSPSRRATDSRAGAQQLLRRFLARPMIGLFLVVPLLGAFLQMGSPAVLLTVAGLAALYLAVDLLLAWLGRPVPEETAASLNLVAWASGIFVLAAGSWSAAAWQFQGELVTLVGAMTAVGVGLGSSRVVAVLWTVAAAAAVAAGASVSGPLTVESAMVAAAMAVGTWFGAVIGVVGDRILFARRMAVPSSSPAGAPAHPRPRAPKSSWLDAERR